MLQLVSIAHSENTTNSKYSMIYWTGLHDNGDSTYSARIRIDDPGDYEIRILVNNHRGCHITDCDVPKEICETFLDYGPRMNHCAVDDACIRVVSKRRIRVRDSFNWPPFRQHMVGGGSNAADSNSKLTYDSDRANLARAILPHCAVDQLGIANGRWISQTYHRSRFTPFGTNNSYPSKISLVASFQEMLFPLVPRSQSQDSQAANLSFSPSGHLDHYPQPYGLPDFPYVWQPYDCQLHWMGKVEIDQCLSSHQIVIVGFSRERTNFFDLFDLHEHYVHYEKLMNTVTLEDIHYITDYHSEKIDRRNWNNALRLTNTIHKYSEALKSHLLLCLSEDEYDGIIEDILKPYLEKVSSSAAADLGTLWSTAISAADRAKLERIYIVRQNDSLKFPLYKLKGLENASHPHLPRKVNQIAIYFTEEALWMSETAYRSSWYPILSHLFAEIKDICPKAKFIYKTASSLRAQFGSLSWQRMWENTRLSAKIAQLHNITVIDSFLQTNGLILEKDVFPDGLHLFSSHKFQGNFVSKTNSMMFLNAIC